MNKVLNYKEEVFGNSILHFMAYDDLNDSAKLLLENGAEVNNRNINEETPLHWAARVGSLKTMEVLVMYHANVNAADVTNGTALHSAAAAGMPDSVPFLLSNGCNWELLDGDGKTALQIAKEYNDEAHTAVAFMIEKNMKACGGYYVPVRDPVPERRSGVEVPGVETQVDDEMLHTTAMQTGIVTRLDVVGHVKEPNRDEIAVSTMHFGEHTSSRPTSPMTRRLSVSLNAVQQTSATNLFMPSPKKKSVMAFWTSSGRSNLGQPAQPVSPELMLKVPERPHPSTFFPPADFVPLTPDSAERLDLIISMEQCADCHLHSMSVWHDPKKYMGAGDAALRATVAAVFKHGYPVRVYALKVKPSRARIGACELTVALRVNQAGAVGKLRDAVSGGGIIKQDPNNKGWFSFCAYSKLKTRNWPNPEAVGQETVGFLDQAFVDMGVGVVKKKNSSKEEEELQAWSKRLFQRPYSNLAATGKEKAEEDPAAALIRAAAMSGNNEVRSDAATEVAFFAQMDREDPGWSQYCSKALAHFYCFDARIPAKRGKK